jgi:hypothetical protein
MGEERIVDENGPVFNDRGYRDGLDSSVFICRLPLYKSGELNTIQVRAKSFSFILLHSCLPLVIVLRSIDLGLLFGSAISPFGFRLLLGHGG